MESNNYSIIDPSDETSDFVIMDNQQLVLKDGLDGNNKIQKSRPLFVQLNNSKLSLRELKIIDVYLSRINSRQANAKEVVFEKTDLERLFGVQRIKKEELEACVNRLLTVSVLFTEDNEGENENIIKKKSETLFREATMYWDKSDKRWRIKLICGELASKLIFNIESYGYLQYALKNIVQIKSINTYYLYTFIESRRNNSKNATYPQTFTVPIDELREKLKCQNIYPEYKAFNRSVLVAGKKEILEKTDMVFDYEPIKNGRFVQFIKFTIYPRKALLTSKDSPDIIVTDDVVEAENSDEQPKRSRYRYNNSYDYTMDRLAEMEKEGESPDAIIKRNIGELAACCDNEYAPNQMEAINEMLDPYFSRESDKREYLRKMYVKMNAEDNNNTIKNRFKYLQKMIENDRDNLVSISNS